MLTLTRTLSTHAAALNHTRTCIPGTYMQAWHANKAYLYPRSRWHGSNMHTHARRIVVRSPPAPFASWPHLPVARDHAQHSATPTPCRTRRITADRRASRCRPPARRSAPAAPRTRSYSVVKTQRPRRPLPGLVASAVKHSATLGRTCRPHSHPWPIKGDAEFPSPPRHPVLAKLSHSTS